jgi:hypothetical protein
VFTLSRSRLTLQLEIIALRHQLTVYQRASQCPRINPGDPIFWSWLSRHWSGWRGAPVFVKARTVIAWQRKRFRSHWAKLSQHGVPGRPPISKEIKELIRYFDYYHRWRTYLSLRMDSPESRSVQLPVLGKIVHNQKSVAYIIIRNGWRLD